MEKEVTIGNKTLILRSSLYSLINYKSRFGSELFNDIKKLENTKEENETFIGFWDGFDLSVLSDETTLNRLSSAIVELLKTDTKAGEKKEETFR